MAKVSTESQRSQEWAPDMKFKVEPKQSFSTGKARFLPGFWRVTKETHTSYPQNPGST